MNLYYSNKWDELQDTDLAVREVQLCFEKIKEYDDCSEILEFNQYLETLRSTIHLKMKEIQRLL